MFGYYKDNTWRCVHKKCSATISVDDSNDTLINTSKASHAGHAQMSLCQIEVKRAIERMKIDITKESTLANKDPRVIYDNNIEY